jgi:hypothetical protein
MTKRFGPAGAVSLSLGCGCALGGGILMVVLGIISAVAVVKDPRGSLVAQYKTAVAQWQTASGSAALQAAFTSAPTLTLLFPAAPVANRPSNVTATVSLVAQTSVTPLGDTVQPNQLPTTYTALWFSNQGVAAPGWPTEYDSSVPSGVLASISGAPSVGSVGLPLWKCTDTALPSGCVVVGSVGGPPQCTKFSRDFSTISTVALVANGVAVGSNATSLGVDWCVTTYTLVSSIPGAWLKRAASAHAPHLTHASYGCSQCESVPE